MEWPQMYQCQPLYCVVTSKSTLTVLQRTQKMSILSTTKGLLLPYIRPPVSMQCMYVQTNVFLSRYFVLVLKNSYWEHWSGFSPPQK